MDDETVGPGSLPGATTPIESAPAGKHRLGPVRHFDYLSSGRSLVGTYRAIMAVFLENRETFGIALSTDEVLERLERSAFEHEARDPDHLEQLLGSLAEDGNLVRSQDTTLARTIEELRRRRSLWRATEQGIAAEQFARQVESVFREGGALRANLLGALERDLADLAAFAALDTFDEDHPALIDTSFDRVFNGARDLAEGATRFLAALDGFMAEPEISPARFELVRDVIVGYVSEFLNDLRRRMPLIADRIRELEGAGIERLIAAAASSEPPPTTDGTDPVERKAAALRERWAGVLAWFAGTTIDEARATYLAHRAAAAIATLFKVFARLNEARHRRINRARDFVALARWFEGAADDHEANRIWHAVFGLGGARHLRYRLPDEPAGSPSWWEVPPVRLEPRLRERGSYESRGQPPAIEDTSAMQARARERLARIEAERESALARFLDRGPFRLSDLPGLSEVEFELLIDCLASTLTTRPDEDGGHLAESYDGRYLISVAPPSDPRAEAVVTCPLGRLRSADWSVELVRANRAARTRAVAS